MPTEKDLFSEEQEMVAMSFGDHIEELRVRLILGLLGLMVGVVITFLPYLELGKRVIVQMGEPAKVALKEFYDSRAVERSKAAKEKHELAPEVMAFIPASRFVEQLHAIAPDLKLPAPESLKDQVLKFPIIHDEGGMIEIVTNSAEPRQAIVSLAPMETMTIYFMVCLVTGLVIASPWVFYQIWAFIAAGLYRHERHYVTKFLPVSLGLFLMGVFLCFLWVLPVTMAFLLKFNVWLGIEPTLRLSEWMSFATIMPLIFGICFQTPLVMLFLERIGILTVDDFRSKRKLAILIMIIAGAILTPTQDPLSMFALAAPMILLYEIGILLIGRQKSRVPSMAD